MPTRKIPPTDSMPTSTPMMANFFTKSWKVPAANDDDSSSQEGLLNGEIEFRDSDQRRRWRMGLVLTILNMLISLAAIGVVSFLVKQSRDNSNAMQPIGIQDQTIFSSLNLQSPLPLRNKSHFSTPEASSIYLQPPSPEVDAAWDSLSLEGYEMTTITGTQARAIGRDTNLMAKVPLSWNLGPDRYFAQIHVFHLIHCLDEIRKQVHWDHYYGGRTPSQEFFNHKNHCLHMLLENLLCGASSEVITHNWRETYHVPIADFDPQPRQCRNFDALRNWASENAIDKYKAKWVKLHVPEGAVVLPAPTPRLY